MTLTVNRLRCEVSTIASIIQCPLLQTQFLVEKVIKSTQDEENIMQVKLKPIVGQQVIVEVDPETTIAWAKIQLYDRYGIDPGVCKTFKDSKVLQDHESFKDHQIKDGDLLHLTVLLGTYNCRLAARGISEEPLDETQLRDCYNTCFAPIVT